MIRLLWAASVATSYFLRRYTPTNRLLDTFRTRRGLWWGVPAMLLVGPYLLAANIFTNIIAGGGPLWLHVFVILFIWNAVRILIMGSVNVILLTRARIHEARQHRSSTRTQIVANGLQSADDGPVGAAR